MTPGERALTELRHLRKRAEEAQRDLSDAPHFESHSVEHAFWEQRRVVNDLVADARRAESAVAACARCGSSGTCGCPAPRGISTGGT